MLGKAQTENVRGIKLNKDGSAVEKKLTLSISRTMIALRKTVGIVLRGNGVFSGLGIKEAKTLVSTRGKSSTLFPGTHGDDGSPQKSRAAYLQKSCRSEAY